MIRKSTYTLLIILLVLATVVIFLQRTPLMTDRSDVPPTPTESPQLFDWPVESNIVAISMTDDRGHFIKASLDQEGAWVVEIPADCRLESDVIANALSQLNNLKVLVAMEAPPALVDVGLLNPTYRLTLTLDDGTLFRLAIGSVVPTGTGYYVQVNNDPVVVVSKFFIDSIFDLVKTACATPTIEAMPSATVEFIQIENVLTTPGP